jgi:dTDP-4-amino-4,6-dideoxygalactose transaminase
MKFGTRDHGYSIPFNKPSLAGSEFQYISDAIGSGQISGDGQFTRKCHQLLQQCLGVPKVLLTTSCTHALEMAALLLNLGPDDEVILPSFTFVSTANAFLLRGARPIFCDIRPDTLNINEGLVESLITPKTKAIVVVHYAGVGCEMDKIEAMAREHGIKIVEDNAHGLFGKYRGKNLGTIGSLATLSFHETKNFTCGEGGALLINREEYHDRAEIIREKGTNRSRFFRGQVDKYSWVDLGSSYLPSDVLAAFLFAQLENSEKIQQRRRKIWQVYANGLADWAQGNRVRLPQVPDHCEQAWHMFYMLLPSLEKRQAFIKHMASYGMLAVFHYLPLHLSEVGQRLGGKKRDCPVTEDISDRLVRLPFYNSLTDDEQARVLAAVRTFEI